jgi:P2 family phage contractile tail tube protein
MALPSKLKNFNVFNAGNNYLGLIESVAMPKLSRKMEDWRGGGMDGAVKADMGQESIQFGFTAGGLLVSALRQYGAIGVGAVLLRFAGAYQRDDTGDVDAVEVVIRGRHSEIDMGDAKPGDATANKFTTEVSYYKLTINGRVEIEIDLLNFIFIVDGVDRLAEQRNALGV